MKNPIKFNKKTSNKSFKKGYFIVIAILLAIVFGMCYFGIKTNNQINILGINKTIKGTANTEITEEDRKVGTAGKISQAIITSRATGTGPFDEDDNPGNDSSKDNNIVRSFDQVTWNIESTFRLKDNVDVESYKGGIIEIEAKVPATCANYVKWDIDSMSWAENAVVSSDGTIFNCLYSLSKNEVTVPGKQSLIFVLKVLGAPNRLEIDPTFKLNLVGNTDEEKIEIIDNTINVSARPQYNVELKKNSELYKEIDLTENGVTTRGRLYGYCLTYQLYNQNVNKGLKGLEYPKGNIGLDIDLKLEKVSMSDSSYIKDITSSSIPVLYNYKLNYYDNTTGYIPNREMNVARHAAHEWRAPTPKGGGLRACYDSGNVTMEQIGNTIHVDIDNYKFNGEFPKEWIGQNELDHTIKYGENIGCFNTSYFQILVPYTEESSEGGYNYYLTVSDKNFSVTSISNTNIMTQEKLNDDLIRDEHYIYRKGEYSEAHWLLKNFSTNFAGTNGLYSYYNRGDAKASIGQKFVNRIDIITANNNDINQYIYDCNELMKFDGEAFKITEINGVTWKKISTIATNCTVPCDMEFQMLYVAKPDGSNWISDDEMKNAVEEDLLFFETEEELKETLGNDAVCVGTLFESISGSITYSSGVPLELALEVTNKAKTGEVYQFVSTSRLYKEQNKLDRTTQTRKNTNAIFPTADVNLQQNYIKTAYDENGNIITGTHGGGWLYGQSLLIYSGKISVNHTIADKNTDGSTKVNYNIGKNENEVSYNIKPKLEKPAGANSTVDDITVTVEDTLPKGLKYIPGSSNSEYGEPNITENSDGTSKLIWNIYGCELDREVPTLNFKAEIDQESENGTEYTNKVIVSADKVEPSLPIERTMTTTIKVINLSSYSLHKTTTTPIIERNGTIKYKIVAENKTDEIVNDFQLLDILPYNGDGRGTNYTGTYKVSKINLKQTNVEGNETPNDNVNIRITQDASVRTGVTAKDENLGTTSIWSGTESGAEINQSLTAYALTGTLPSHTKMEIEVIIETEGNKENDIYINSVSGQTNKTTDEIVSGKVKTEVIKRILVGKVWFDNNANGVIDNGESLLKDIEVTLLNSDKTPAKNVFGENFEPINTDNNGYYKFEDMVKGDYIVQIKYDTDSNKKEITEKGIGNNITINNKFNSGVSSGENTEKAYTDVITTLNSISSPTLLEKYVNAGIKYKDAKVLVKHYIMLPDGTKTTNLVPLVDENESAEITIEGRINDNYETNRAGVPEYYEYVEVVGTPAGTMQTEETTVKYYYRLKKYPYKVNYLEKGTNKELCTKDGEEKTYGTEITVTSEKINIPKFEYDSADVNGDDSKNKLTIGTTVANNVINIYYTKKKGTVVAKYIDKNTGLEIASREEKKDKIDEEYKTDKKEIEGYTFVEDTGNTEGYYTLESSVTPIEVKYYYKQNTKVIVKYIDKATNEEIPKEDGIDSKEIQEGLVGDEYTSSAKNFDKYVLIERPEEETVTMTPEEITLKYYYSHVSAGVVEKHIDYYSEELLDNKEYEGNEGDDYETKRKTFEGYELVEEKLPENATGKMTKDLIEVKYYYKYPSKVIAKYVDKITGKEIPETEVIKQGYNGEDYKTEQKEIERYEFIEVKGNEEGKMTKDTITVTYYYKKVSAGIVENHYDVLTGEKLQEEKVYKGLEGDEYETSEKIIDGYDIVEEKRPENAKGKMTVEEIRVDYYYKKRAKIVAKYIDFKTGIEITIEETNGHVEDEYETEQKEFEEYDLIEVEGETKGSLEDKPKEVKYYYIRKADVEVKYLEEGTDKILSEHDIIKGHVGDEYKAEEKEIEGYELVKEKLPENSEGQMEEKTQEVKYYYKKKTEVIVKYIDKQTGKELTKTENIKGYKGDEYKTDKKEIKEYDYIEMQGQPSGKMEETTAQIIYYYVKKAEVEVKYIEEGTKKEIAEKEIINGHVEENYQTERKNISGYEYVKVEGQENGQMTEEKQNVIYYYKKIKKQETPKPTKESEEPKQPEQNIEQSEQKVETELVEEKEQQETQNSYTPKTGDKIYKYYFIFAISVIGLGITIIALIKKKNNNNKRV